MWTNIIYYTPQAIAKIQYMDLIVVQMCTMDFVIHGPAWISVEDKVESVTDVAASSSHCLEKQRVGFVTILINVHCVQETDKLLHHRSVNLFITDGGEMFEKTQTGTVRPKFPVCSESRTLLESLKVCSRCEGFMCSLDKLCNLPR